MESEKRRICRPSGGGFPATYAGDRQAHGALQAMGAGICARVRGLKARGMKLVIEPGRSISANAGVLLTRVEYLKQGWDRQIVIVDAGMNVLLRPTLHGAHHTLWPVCYAGFSGHWRSAAQAPGETVDVVGPICETGNYLALARDLPKVDPGASQYISSALEIERRRRGASLARRVVAPQLPHLLQRAMAYEICAVRLGGPASDRAGAT